MKIYIVQEYGGQWEDSWERTVCAFEDRADAEKLRDEIIKAHKEQDKQKEKCQECKYMYEREGDKPKCFKPMAYDPEECETLDIIYDDWCGVDIRELEYVQSRNVMWICPNCGLEVHKDFKKCVRCGYVLARIENGEREIDMGLVTKVHNLKIKEDYADAVLCGDKTFEVRRNDRGFQKGDIVHFIPLYRSDGLEMIGHPLSEQEYEITYVHSGLGLEQDYVVFGIKRIK